MHIKTIGVTCNYNYSVVNLQLSEQKKGLAYLTLKPS